MKKCIAMILVVLSLFLLTSCDQEHVVMQEYKTYEISTGINSLNISINAADFSIKTSDKISVKSNLKYLSVFEKDGELLVVDEAKHTANYNGAVLELCIPNGVVFERVKINTGAAKMTVDSLSANTFDLDLGAGKVKFNNLKAYSKINIDGGAGEVIIENGMFKNLTMNLGVGKSSVRAVLLGESELKFGVGESNLTVVGKGEDYKLDIQKGVGSITLDGVLVSSSVVNGFGQHCIKIQGGVGAVNVKFQEN